MTSTPLDACENKDTKKGPALSHLKHRESQDLNSAALALLSIPSPWQFPAL